MESMAVLAWTLAVVFDPSQFNEAYRTPDMLERTIADYATKEDCIESAQALAKGQRVTGGLRVQCYWCVPRGHDLTLARPLDDAKVELR